MTDAALLAKKLALIETCVEQLRRLARPEALGHDVREERFVEHTLQIALDVASHIVSDERLGEPRTSREFFTELERAGWVSADLAQTLRNMVGFCGSATAPETFDRSLIRAFPPGAEAPDVCPLEGQPTLAERASSGVRPFRDPIRPGSVLPAPKLPCCRESQKDPRRIPEGAFR